MKEVGIERIVDITGRGLHKMDRSRRVLSVMETDGVDNEAEPWFFDVLETLNGCLKMEFVDTSKLCGERSLMIWIRRQDGKATNVFDESRPATTVEAAELASFRETSPIFRSRLDETKNGESFCTREIEEDHFVSHHDLLHAEECPLPIETGILKGSLMDVPIRKRSDALGDFVVNIGIHRRDLVRVVRGSSQNTKEILIDEGDKITTKELRERRLLSRRMLRHGLSRVAQVRSEIHYAP